MGFSLAFIFDIFVCTLTVCISIFRSIPFLYPLISLCVCLFLTLSCWLWEFIFRNYMAACPIFLLLLHSLSLSFNHLLVTIVTLISIITCIVMLCFDSFNKFAFFHRLRDFIGFFFFLVRERFIISFYINQHKERPLHSYANH